MPTTPDENVVKLELSRPAALKILQEIASSSERVRYTTHAKKRMWERGITSRQVMTCLKKGLICEGPARSSNGNWELSVNSISAGTPITVIAALGYDKNGNYVLIMPLSPVCHGNPLYLITKIH